MMTRSSAASTDDTTIQTRLVLLVIALSIVALSSSPMVFSLQPVVVLSKTTRTSTTQLWMAGFGSPASPASSNKNKKGGKNKNKKKVSGGETPAQAQLRWANKMKKVYGGITAEEIAIGTEKRIGSMITESLSLPLRKALELREIVQQFERKISGMDAEAIRQRFAPEELEQAIANRKAFDEHLQNNNLAQGDLQVAMQRLTWDASADAKACKSVTGKMPTTFKNRVTRASEMAYEASPNDGLVLDVGCGYGVLIPFLKKAGFKANQIHGVDLSSEMIGHAKTFYPDVASKGKFEALDFFADVEDDSKNKYRSVVFCSALHDMPDLKRALIKTKNELLDATSPGSRLVIIHAQGASHVLNQTKQNPLLVPRGLPTIAELQEWLCNDNQDEDDGGPTMKIVHEPALSKSQDEVREGYLAVLEII